MYWRTCRRVGVLGIMLAATYYGYEYASGEEQQKKAEGKPAAVQVTPKPLSEAAQKGLAYLVSQQHEDGGWGQGGGWRGSGTSGGRIQGDNVADPSDLGNTCIAALALIRSGSTPKSGPYAENLSRAADFICRHVEQADGDDLYVTDIRNTQLQRKIGQYVDTFLAGLVLSELKWYMPGHERRLKDCLAKVIAKIEKNQREDGSFDGNHGWASVLSYGLCSKLVNRAAQQNFAISDDVLKRDFQQSVAGLAVAAKPAGPVASTTPLDTSATSRPAVVTARGGGDAGVALYSAATNTSRVQAFYQQNRREEAAARQTLASADATETAKKAAEAKLQVIGQAREAQQSAAEGIIEKLDNEQFVAGFGNNGGEEFLSYMNISETLVEQGGAEWERWDASISKRLADVQNGDGSWSGHHCITGRTFCTATALLTLLADRAPGQWTVQLQLQMLASGC